MIATCRWLFEDITASGSSAAAFADINQRPSLVMPIGTTSYLALSIALMTDSADRRDTSCSPERPPKITPILSFLVKFLLRSVGVSRLGCRIVLTGLKFASTGSRFQLIALVHGAFPVT